MFTSWQHDRAGSRDDAGPMSATSPSQPSAFAALDDAKVNRFQMKIMFVSGMGFFTDAYDLFVIGIVVKILTDQWHLSATQISLLSSMTLAASAVGALLFGRVADMIGRKKMYGFEVLILAAGAIASAFSPEHHLADHLPDHPRHRDRRRLPGERDDHERVRRQGEPRQAGRPRVRDAGRRPDRRPADRGHPARGRRRSQPRLAPAARPRRDPRPRRLLPAPSDPRDATLRDGGRRARRGARRRSRRRPVSPRPPPARRASPRRRPSSPSPRGG